MDSSTAADGNTGASGALALSTRARQASASRLKSTEAQPVTLCLTDPFPFHGPFGEVIRATGPMAKANPFRFSTKYQDDETDLLYYVFRYYNASAGRWLSRDPLGETATENVYSFCENAAIDAVDVVGLASDNIAVQLSYSVPTGAPGTRGSVPLVLPWLTLDYKLSFGMQIEGRADKKCCRTGGPGWEVTATVNSRMFGEAGITAGRFFATDFNWWDWHARKRKAVLSGYFGVRGYGRLQATGSGSLKVDTCGDVFQLTTSVNAQLTLGAEAGLMLELRYTLPGGGTDSVGLGATGYVQANCQVPIVFSCGTEKCTLRTGIQGNWEAGARAKLGFYTFEYKFAPTTPFYAADKEASFANDIWPALASELSRN